MSPAGWPREANQWQSLSPDRLVALAGPLAGPGEPARAWREKIAAQLEQTLLATPAGVRAQGNALGAAIQAMAPGLSDAQKQRWRAKVREAFQAKASMTPADLQTVSDWLGLLGEAPANAHVADWTLAQTAWQGWASQDVRWLMGQLGGPGGGAKDARGKVATHVMSTTISRPEGLAGMPAAELGELVSAVAPALTTAQRREALEAMRAAFGGKAMSAGVLRSVEAVVRPLGEGAFVDFVGEWVSTQKSWQEFSLSDLNSLHELLKISPSARGPRASVAAQLTAAVLGDAKAMQGAPVEAVCQAAEGIAQGAPASVRERWTAALRARYGQAPLAGTDLARVRQTLATLGDVGGEEFLAGWVAAQASWTTWPSQDLAGLAGQLRGTSERTRAARAKIASHVAARVAQPQPADQAVALGGLVQAVAGDWTPLQRSQCVTALRVEVGPKAASLEALRAIEPVCRPLGDEVFRTVVGDWVNAQTDWQRFSPADLNALYDLLKPSEAARGARVKVAAQLTALALNEATALHGLSPASICLRARGIAPDLAPALRERWIAALRGLFGKAAISRAELTDVRETLQALGDAQGEQFLADWVAAQGSWTAWSGQDIAGLLGQLKGTGEAACAARSKLAAQLSATVVAPEALASMPLEALGQVVTRAAAGWTPAQRAAFLESAGPALTARAAAIETLRAVEPICRALGDDAFGVFLARWVDGQQAWRQFSLADMNALYGLMKAAGCRQAARASVVARISATILGNAQSFEPAAAGALSQSARALASDMPPAVREQWVGAIHAAFAKAPLSLADLTGLREALTALGDARSEQFIPAWVASQGTWKNWSSEDLSALGARVSGAGDLAKAARGEIAAHRAAQIAQREALAAMSTSALQQFVQSAGSWSPAQRSQCLASVRAVFGAKAMPLDTLRALAGVFQSLGAEAEYLPFVGEWVHSQDAWQRYSLGDINSLYNSLRGPEGLKPARAKIAAQVTATMLGEAKNGANATAGALCQAARTVLPDASGAVREQWAGAIRTTFAKAPLTRAELTDVESTLAALGEAHPEGFVNAWSTHQECWKTWPISDLAGMVASGGASPDMKAVRARASAHMLSLATAGAETLGAMPVSALGELVRSAGGTWTDAQRAQVAAAVKSGEFTSEAQQGGQKTGHRG